MLTAHASHPPALLPGASARSLLALLSLLAVGLMCGAPSVITTAPAGELQLAIQLDNALVAGDAPVQITVQVSDPSRGGYVALSGGQRLTCGGVSFPGDKARGVPWSLATFLGPRQPPGGAYTCVYTDERGRQTTATIPVPLAPLAFTAPTAGAHVPIPILSWPRPAPSTPANGLCPDDTQLDQPLDVHYTFPVPPGYTPPLPSQGAAPTSFMLYGDYAGQKPFAIVTAQASYGFFQPPPAQYCKESGLGQAATGTYALPFVMTSSSDQFEQLVPAPGYLTLNLAMQWLPPAGGFHAILVDSQDSVTIPISWTASH